MLQVEDNPDQVKNEEEFNDNEDYNFDKWLKEQSSLKPSESDKVYLDVIFGKKTEMTKEEFDGLWDKYFDLVEKEDKEAEKKIAEGEDNETYELKEDKNSPINLDELNGIEVDKNSEFYKKYKTEIDNFDNKKHRMKYYKFKIVKKKKDDIKV